MKVHNFNAKTVLNLRIRLTVSSAQRTDLWTERFLDLSTLGFALVQ